MFVFCFCQNEEETVSGHFLVALLTRRYSIEGEGSWPCIPGKCGI